MLKHHSLRVISFEEPEVFVSVDASCQKLLLLLLQLRVDEVKHMGHAFGVRVGHRVRHVVKDVTEDSRGYFEVLRPE